jgi:membrane-bound lytic murein transglycosylase D
MLLGWPRTGGTDIGYFLSLPVEGPDSLAGDLPPLATPPDAADAPIAVLPMEPAAEPLGSEPVLTDDPWAEAVVSLLDPYASAVSELPPYPVVKNDSVRRFIEIFQSEGKRQVVGRWLDRSSRYLEMIRSVFRQKGLPEELAYTAMIESGFNPVAVSRAGAKGLWQFMEQTARRYGLTVNQWVDERLDPQKSTAAAAEYLKDLFAQFGSWFLAQAAYNAGEIKVARAIQHSGSQDFWDLTRGRVLREETKRFVPAIQAATLIAREPERYGFEVTPEPPEAFVLVTVPFSLELRVVAKLGEISPEILKQLNPELRRAVTPPGGSYALKVPPGSGPPLQDAMGKLAASDSFRWVIHPVRKGQTLPEVARSYRTTVERLREINNLTASTIRPGTELVVPVPPRPQAVAVKSRSARGAGELIYVVKRGETLSGIAQRHQVSVDEIARLNGLTDTRRIYPGDRLRVVDSGGQLEARAAQ